jgi:hypothetical protein
MSALQPQNEEKSLYIIGGIAAILQLVAILSYGVVIAVLGPKPATAEEYFTIYQANRLAAALRGDLLLLILIGLYLGTFPALYVALRRLNPIYTALATVFTLIAVTGAFASESTFSLFQLGEQYAAATEEQRVQLLGAARGIMASDMWSGTAAYMGDFCRMVHDFADHAAQQGFPQSDGVFRIVGEYIRFDTAYPASLFAIRLCFDLHVHGIVLLCLVPDAGWDLWRLARRCDMGPGHFGVAFAVKPIAPKAPLWVLLVASEVLDLLCYGVVAIGMESTSIRQIDLEHGVQTIVPGYLPWSHDCSCRSFGRRLQLELPISVFVTVAQVA